MTKREKEILEMLRKYPMIAQNEIAERLNITRSSVGVHIKNLVEKGYILGRGYILTEDEYITVIGGANIDIVGTPNEELIAKDSNPGKIHTSCGGVGRNISENLGRLGGDIRLITAIGNDNNGELIKSNANEVGIDLSNSLFSENHRTATYLAILDDKHDMSMAIADMDIIDAISPEIISNKQNLIKNSKLCVLDTNLRKDTLDYVMKNIDNDYFVDTVSTIKAKKIVDLLPYIHTLKPNKYEAELLSGISIKTEMDVIVAGNEIVKKGVKHVFLTLGEKGLFYFDKDRHIKVKSTEIHAENSTGAGDAFMAGLAYSYYNNYSIEDTIYTAVGASRLTVKDKNTISSILTLENIKKEKEEIEIC